MCVNRFFLEGALNVKEPNISGAKKEGGASRILQREDWEVLNGVGVDGVGVIFPFFYAFFLFFMHFSSIFTHFSPSPKGQGQTTAIYCKNGEFHSDPVCTDPVQNFPRKAANNGRLIFYHYWC